jgi:hypothetical protein
LARPPRTDSTSSVDVHRRSLKGGRLPARPGRLDHNSVDGKHWPSRFVTLAEGKHIIRVTMPKPQKIVTYDESPSALTSNVEVLDRGIRIGRRGVAIEPRRRTRRGAKIEEPVEARTDANIIEEPAVEARPSSAEPGEKRSRRPRGGRGRGRSTAAAEPETVHLTPEPVIEPAPEHEAAAVERPESAEDTPATKRRRRPRGGRGRRKSTAAVEPQGVESTPESAAGPEPTPEPELAVAQQPESAEEAPKRRRRSPRRQRQTKVNNSSRTAGERYRSSARTSTADGN